MDTIFEDIKASRIIVYDGFVDASPILDLLASAVAFYVDS